MQQAIPTAKPAGLLRPALALFIALSVITGLIYPLITTGVAKLAFPHQASGSLIKRNGQVIGSSLIGQPFSSPGYFWGRPSATSPMPDNAASSGGSNLGPANPDLTQAAKDRIAALKAADPANTAPVPVDLVTASASGLDPQISPAAADYQIARVARARKLPEDAVRKLVEQYTKAGAWMGLLGDATVNVLELNLALDKVSAAGH